MATIAPEWKAGTATAVITPSRAMWMAGYAARTRPSTGTACDLQAKALALESVDGDRLVIVTADLIAVSPEIAAAVAKQAANDYRLSRERLLFSASHTHCGPEIRPGKAPFFGIPPDYVSKIEPYVTRLQGKLIALVGEAVTELKPARLAATRATVHFARNRRSEDGPVDHDVPILDVTDVDGRRRAILFGYACHNVTLPPSFLQFCGDYAGFAQRLLEAAYPGATALFLAGAGADQDPEPCGALEQARQHGGALAESVERALAGSGREVHGPLRIAFEEVALEFQPLPERAVLEADLHSSDMPRRVKAQYLLRTLAEKGALDAAYPCPVHVVRFGEELLLIALGGEPVVNYSNNLKAELAGPLVWVAGYANDMFGYLPTRRVQREGGYEGGRAILWSPLPAPFTETVQDRVMEAARRLARRVRD